MSRYAVGIDLGTTNCALAWVDLEIGLTHRPATPMEIPQLVDVGEIASRRLLPSFVYLSTAGEFPPGALDLPWKTNTFEVVGEAGE